jgi:predicted transposase/invertase (TIGR01784 family)
MLQLRKLPWRQFIRSNNPVAVALLGIMNYTEKEKISIKIEAFRMMTSMQLDPARSALLTAFIETYVKLTEEEEIIYRDRLKQELTQQEVEKLIEITTSYHEKGKEEGKLEGKTEVAKKMLAKNISIDEIVELTELTREQVEKLKKQGN